MRVCAGGATALRFHGTAQAGNVRVVPLIWALAFVPLLIGLNAFFVISEYAVVATRPAQLQRLRATGRARAADAMERLKDDPTSAIGAIQVCITMTNLMLGWIGEPAMSAVLHRAFGPIIQLSPTIMTAIATALSFILVTLLTVVFSELLPKALTLRYVEPAAAITAVPVLGIRKAIFPLVWVMNTMANLITRPLGLGRVEEFEEGGVTADELRVLAMQAGLDGVVTPREQSLILNALTIGKRRANEIMVPRTRVAYVDLRRTWDENMRVVEEYLFSRMPLCDKGMDHVLGVVLTRELLTAHQAGADMSVLTLLTRPPVFAPERVTLDRLIETFHDKRTEMVFLVDEYGGVEGIVTQRDVLDELLRPPGSDHSRPPRSPPA
jgi:CBS domain containing-hemolysin-like protein